MTQAPHQDLVLWQVHETEDDCDLIIRTNNGFAFYCQISPASFQNSPKLLKQYFLCLDLLRSGEEEIDDFYMEDACDWLSKLFEPLIGQLAPSPPVLPSSRRPTLSEYLFPPFHVCKLEATDGMPRAVRQDTQEHGWSSPSIRVDDDFLSDLDSWTRSYDPTDIELCYDNPRDVLIKRPTKILAKSDSTEPVLCFFKRFELSFGPAHAKKEVSILKQITQAQIPSPPKAWICRLHGIVRAGNSLMGMLFTWIDAKGPLSKARVEQSLAAVRKRWRAQITQSVMKLHDNKIVWGDAKAENVLIDKEDNAWIIDFGGSYTPGWVDPEKAGSVAGDEQGLAKILDILQTHET